ncbi:ABC transporter permease [Cohnella zeiphila]|uniref:Sugar ABC transporter permease n=1 Tax=Cohnella zeiphila TaxID=2761120 RepID=A0A7X0SQ41_9BACL|nr:ABC transporter permease subunit [Cohnella zeiphila]MBB6734014.1 sugar ABC transporter permease [Cohnella zeiphila]
MIEASRIASKPIGRQSRGRRMLRNWELYLFLVPAIAYFLVFYYWPMYGIQIAFKNYVPSKGFLGSPWVGFEHFERFFHSYYFWDLLWNTLSISFYALAVGFPLPIILALAFNEVRNGAFKKTVQTVTYAPHFISMVVMCGMIMTFLSPSSGMIVRIIELLGMEPAAFLTDPHWFKTVYVLSEVWQSTGWGAIIYLAALSGVDPQLHEAAIVDGAGRFKRMWHINLPAIVPTIVILLILNMGNILGVGYEKILLLQNPLNMESSDVISTFVYRSALVNGQYSFSTAVGLFNSVINAFMLVVVNLIAKRTSNNSLW